MPTTRAEHFKAWLPYSKVYDITKEITLKAGDIANQRHPLWMLPEDS